MALQTNELYSEATRGALPRIQPEGGPGAVVVKQFKTGSGTLPVGCPLYIEAASGFMVKLAPGGTAHSSATVVEQIHAIVWPTDVLLDGSGEVHGTVMLKGQVHLEDMAVAHGTASNNANFLLSCRNPITAYRGIHIDGLTLAK